MMTFGIQMFGQMTVRSEMLRRVTFGIQTIVVNFRNSNVWSDDIGIQMFGKITF